MSDLENRPEPQPPEPPDPSLPSTGSDPWQIWFSKVVQVIGLLIMIFEAARILLIADETKFAERPWLMMFAMGMLLGGMGLQAVLRWAMTRMAP